MRQAATVAILDKIRNLQNEGRFINVLLAGDPDFPTPTPIIESAHKAITEGKTHYSSSRGLPELRKAIVADFNAKHKASYNWGSEVLVTHGAIHAYYCAMRTVLNPGDEVLIPDPTWVSHPRMVEIVGATPVMVPTYPEEGFFPSIEELNSFVTPKTKALVINSPNNPTGAVASYEYLKQIADFVDEHNLYIISDEVYGSITYEHYEFTSLASFPKIRKRLVILNSFSKTYSMTGWRLGYLLAPSEIIDNALKASQYSVTCIAPFIQMAGVEALTNEDVQVSVKEMLNNFSERRKRVIAIYKEERPKSFTILPPQGAFYFLLDIRHWNISSEKVVERLIEEEGVAFVPGAYFGDKGEGFLRMTISASDETIENGFRTFIKWADHHFG